MAVKLLDAVTTTSTSNAWALRMGVETHTVTVHLTGSPTSVAVHLLGSINDTQYHTLAHHILVQDELDNGYSMFHVVSKLVSSVKAQVTTLSGGTNPTVSVFYLGQEKR